MTLLMTKHSAHRPRRALPPPSRPVPKGTRSERTSATGYTVIYSAFSSYTGQRGDYCFGPMHPSLEEARAAARHCANWQQAAVRIEYWGRNRHGGEMRQGVVEIVRPGR